MVKRKINTKIYLLAAFFTMIIFFTGILLDRMLTNTKNELLINYIREIEEEQTNTQLEFLLLERAGKNNTCDLLDYEITTLGKTGEQTRIEVARYEESGKIYTKEFKDLKKKYTSLLIRNWLFFKEFKENCNSNMTIILYFYSNKYCNDCNQQGSVLTYMQRKYPSIKVISLDSDLDMNVMKLMKRLYDIKNVTKPVLIINEKKYEGLKSRSDLEKILKL